MKYEEQHLNRQMPLESEHRMMHMRSILSEIPFCIR